MHPKHSGTHDNYRLYNLCDNQNHFLHTKHVPDARYRYIAHDVCIINSHVRLLQEKLCEKTSYIVKSQWNILVCRLFWFGERWNFILLECLFYLNALYFRLDSGIHQNIICQFLQWAITPKFSSSKILYRTVCINYIRTLVYVYVCKRTYTLFHYWKQPLKCFYYNICLQHPLLPNIKVSKQIRSFTKALI